MVTATATLVSLAGCSADAPAGGSYFPLEAGHRWTYRMTSTWENDTVDREDIELRNLGEQAFDDGSRAWHRRSVTGMDYWLRADATGVFRVASRSDNMPRAEADPAPRYVLRQPIAVGTQWQAPTTAYLLRRRQEFPPEIRHTHAPVPMSYAIEALGLGVDTPAGHFDGCVRVKGTALMRLFADPVQGWRDLPLTTREWYCPGVGLVRLEREEPAQSTFLTGGRLTMELTSWQ